MKILINIILYLSALLGIIIPSDTDAQTEYKAVIPDINEKLSKFQVHCILQDRFGYLWFGSSNGLFKYDGYNLKEYINDPNNPQSLHHNNVFMIHEDLTDSGKTLWIGTGDSFDKFDRTSQKFIHYGDQQIGLENSIQKGIGAICQDSSGNLWLGGQGLSVLSQKSGEVSEYLKNKEPLLVYSIAADQSEVIWAGSNYGLIKLEPKIENDSNYTIYPLKSEDPYTEDRVMVSEVYVDRNNVVWIGANEGIYKFDKILEKFIRPQLKVGDFGEGFVLQIGEDAKGNLWASGKDLLKINSNRDSSIRYPQYLDMNDTTNSISVRAFCVDISCNIWVSSFDKGIIKLVPIRKNFNHYKNNPDDPFSLIDNNVTSFIEDNQERIWIGTEWEGINLYDNRNNRFYIAGVSPIAYTISIDRSGVLWYPSLACLTSYDPSNGLTIAHFGDGILTPPTKFRMSKNPDRNQAERERIYNNTDPKLIHMRDASNGIFYCYIDNEGIIWSIHGPVGTIYQYDPSKGEYTPYKIYTNENISNAVIMLFEDSGGTLWFGTAGRGLVKRIKGVGTNENDKFIQYINEKDNLNSMSNNYVQTICEDSHGKLWIGTASGLNEFDPKTENFTRYGKRDGLPSEMIAGIIIDNQNFIWISSDKGLSRLDPISKEIKSFNESDGLQADGFKVRSCYKDSKGILYFGGENGFNMYDPQRIYENEILPNIQITGFQLFNKDVSPLIDGPLNFSLEFTKEIILDYDQDIFTFEFSALEFTNPSKNKYAYKMEGVDPDWVYTNSERRYATYTKLDPGEYTFKVKGSNNDAVWNEQGTSLKIMILPPWWLTNWAYSSYILLIAVLIFTVWRIQMNRLRLKHQAELEHFQVEKYQEIDRMKSRFFANISHEFRTPLTLILGPVKKLLEDYKNNSIKHELNTVYRNANRLLQLVNQLLDLSKIEARRKYLKTSYENIIPLLNGMVLSFASLAESKKISLKFTTDQDELFIYIDRDILGKIINNLLSNAFKFTHPEGQIDVILKEGDEYAEITVSDTGIGIREDKIEKIFDRFYQVDESQTREYEGTGIGLSLTKELVELHKGEIFVKSEEKVGSTFTVRLPLGKDHLDPDEIVDNVIEEETLIDVQPEAILSPVITNEKHINLDIITESGKPVLLIVEDNMDVRNYVKEYLHKDYVLLEAADGKDGLETSVQYIPDLIISDVMMPRMDGFEFCEKIKTDEKTSHIPVILLTAKATGEDKLVGLETGADDYLMKPFDAKELKVRIKNLIEQRKRLRDHFKNEVLVDFEKEKINSTDKRFLKKTIELVNENISNDSFGVENLSEKVAMSRSQLHRKMIALIGESPGDFIRRIRMTKAIKLLKDNFGNISEIALEVGFSNPANFSRSFTKQFGISPSEYKREL